MNILQVLSDSNIKSQIPIKKKYETLFSTFVLTAVTLDKFQTLPKDPKWVHFFSFEPYVFNANYPVKQLNNPLFEYLRLLLLARYESFNPYLVQEEMDKFGFTTEQQDFAWKWIRKEINLVEVDVDKLNIHAPKLLQGILRYLE